MEIEYKNSTELLQMELNFFFKLINNNWHQIFTQWLFIYCGYFFFNQNHV